MRVATHHRNLSHEPTRWVRLRQKEIVDAMLVLDMRWPGAGWIRGALHSEPAPRPQRHFVANALVFGLPGQRAESELGSYEILRKRRLPRTGLARYTVARSCCPTVDVPGLVWWGLPC